MVGLLLLREGYEVVSGPRRPGTAGPDYVAVSPDLSEVVVQAKHIRRQGSDIGKHILRQFADDIERYRQQRPTAKGLLVFSNDISPKVLDTIRDSQDISVWDRQFVAAVMDKHKDLERVFQETIDAKGSFQAKVQRLLHQTTSRASDLCEALRAVPCGRDHWREYERVCAEMLTYALVLS